MTALVGLLLSAMVMMTTAQTTTRRPKVVTNTAASYQYSYQYGYRAGYEDGFVKGRSDVNEGKAREIEGSTAYTTADRGYQERYGTRAEYQEAYRIGFEVAYNDGFFGRPYSITMPTNLGRIVVATVNAGGQEAPAQNQSTASAASTAGARPRTTEEPPRAVREEPQDRQARPAASRNAITIPDGVQMKVRLTSEINTKVNREGDRFTAIVLDPSDYAEAEVTGHIAKLNRSGKATGKTELSLVFDTIELRNGRSGRIAAQVEKVYESETVRTVDEEGNVETSSRTKDTATRSVGGAALGAIIGAVAGGGKGAAIGAAIGAGVGAGSVFIQGGKDLILSPGTEMLIRTAAPARTRE
jgi:hypothetical protein